MQPYYNNNNTGDDDDDSDKKSNTYFRLYDDKKIAYLAHEETVGSINEILQASRIDSRTMHENVCICVAYRSFVRFIHGLRTSNISSTVDLLLLRQSDILIIKIYIFTLMAVRGSDLLLFSL